MHKDNTNHETNYHQVDKDKTYLLEWAMVNTRELMLLGLALTTMGVVYIAASDKAHEYNMGIYLSAVIASAATLFIYMLVDWLLGVLIPIIEPMWFGKANEESSQTGLLRILLTVLAIGLLGMSGGMTFLTGKIFSLTVNKAPDTTDIERQVADENGTYNLQLEEINKELEQARRTEATRLKEAKQEKAAMIKAAINSKGGKMAELYHEGNGWAMGKLRANIDKATTAGDQKIEAERNVAKLLSAQKATLLTDGGDAKNQTLQGLIGIKQAKFDVYNQIVATYQNYIIFIDIFLVCGVFFLTPIIGIVRKRFTKQYDVETGYAMQYIMDRIRDMVISLFQLLQWTFGMTVLVFQRLGDYLNGEIITRTGLDVATLNGNRPRFPAPNTTPTQYPDTTTRTDTTLTDTADMRARKKADTTDTEKNDTPAKPRATRDTVDTGRGDTTDTAPIQTREPSATQTVTIIEKLVKDPDAIVKMIKRMRRRWARSFADHPDAPSSQMSRQNLRELAQEEWEILEDLGYKIKESNERFKLDVIPPSKK